MSGRLPDSNKFIKMLSSWILAAGFALGALGQTSTTSVFLPIIDSQPLVASLSKEVSVREV